MDPQQRLLLETTWEALECAMIVPQTLRETQTAVYVGISNFDYQNILALSNERHSTYSITGNTGSISSGRISYTFGFKGPSISIDTACSSSLVAIHLARHSLITEESQMSIACGVNIILLPRVTNIFEKMGMLSPDGKCKSKFSKFETNQFWTYGHINYFCSLRNKYIYHCNSLI
jgi:acyl transferase domain-containing protein